MKLPSPSTAEDPSYVLINIMIWLIWSDTFFDYLNFVLFILVKEVEGNVHVLWACSLLLIWILKRADMV